MSRVVLGNRHAHQSLDNGETFEPLPKGKRATVVELDDDMPIAQAFQAITGPGGVWAAHVHQVKGETPPPAWVASDDAALATLIAAQYGGIEIRELEEPA
jgi:hypothetical protein